MTDEETNETQEETAEVAHPDAAEASPPDAASEPQEAPAADVSAPPAEQLAPKERRRRARAAKLAGVGPRPQRTPEERQDERHEERRRKAAARRLRRAREREKAKATDTQSVAIPPREHGPGKQKTRQGIVVSDRAEKTITVRIDVTRRHRRYGKVVRTSNTLHAHDERGDAHVGDTVIVRESRPLSRTKRWRLVEVVQRAR